MMPTFGSMNYVKYFVYLIISIFLLESCSKKTIPVSKNNKENKKDFTVENIIQSVNAKAINGKYIQAKGQVSLDGSGFFSSGSLSLRIAMDSLIWFSVSKLGIEITRGIITLDSVYAVNNWENAYWKGSLEDISAQYQVPANFKDIQSIILPSMNAQSQYLLNTNDLGYSIHQQGSLVKKYTIDTSLIVISSLSVSYTGADLKVNYTDYAPSGNFIFPYTHTHFARNANDIHETKIKFSSILIVDKINTPFNIPTDYELIK